MQNKSQFRTCLSLRCIHRITDVFNKQVYSEVHFVRAKEMICRSVAIDDSLGRDTLFLFSWTNYQLYNNIRIFIANNTSTKKARITDQDMTNAAFKCNGQCDVSHKNSFF